MTVTLKIAVRSIPVLLAALLLAGCGVYSFKDVSIPPNIKTIKVEMIENRAPYVNPQLAPVLTERLQRNILSQTKLRRTNSDSADYVISATILDYAVTTAGVANGKEVQNRLTVTVEVTINDLVNQTEKKHTVSRPFDFPATFSLQAAESSATYANLIRGLADDIFNRLFSEW
ncbi:MAG: hypothetical protein JWP27_1541 [Flaviaesturariibacter sp.]|nr:hypothetical protein [Flaviaesturariibacter sp.]